MKANMKANIKANIKAAKANKDTTTQDPPKQTGLLVNLAFNIIIPTLVLTKLSTPDTLGPQLGIIVALLFPIGFGLWDLKSSGKFNPFSILGIISVFLTGGMSLLELDPAYIAIKEAAIPGIIGLAVLISQKTSFPIVKKLLLNDQIVNTQLINDELEKHGKIQEFEKKVGLSSLIVAASFFLSSALNYFLAVWILVSPPGTPEYNEELGKMTALSYPVIVVPSMILLFVAIFYLFAQIKKLTGQDIETFMNAK